MTSAVCFRCSSASIFQELDGATACLKCGELAVESLLPTAEAKLRVEAGRRAGWVSTRPATPLGATCPAAGKGPGSAERGAR